MAHAEPLAHAGEAAEAFARGAPVTGLDALGAGLIHRTFAVQLTGSQPRQLVLQRLNTEIFAAPDALMQNLLRITEHLAGQLRSEGRDDVARRVLSVARTEEGAALHRDAEGGCWRAFPRIEGGVPLPNTRNLAQLTAAAAAFGDFARRLAELPGPPLAETLPGFHDFPRRAAACEDAAARDPHGRAAQASTALERLRAARAELERWLPAADVASLPLRVAHHDCKLDNLLFDATSGKALCVVDLDTTMPGTLLSDFGELVRSATGGGRDESESGQPQLDLRVFDALARGYLGAAGSLLEDAELRAFPLAGAHLALMNAMRFLTDHLEGDVYFRLFRPGQNLARAETQLALAEQVLARREALSAILERASP